MFGLGNDPHGVHAYHSNRTRLNATAFQDKDLCRERLFRVQVHEVLGHGLDCLPFQIARQIHKGEGLPKELHNSRFIQEVLTGQQRFFPRLCQQPDVLEAYQQELSRHGAKLWRHLGRDKRSFFSLHELNAYNTEFLYGTPQRLKALSRGLSDSSPHMPHNPTQAERLAYRVLEYFPNTILCLRKHRRAMLQTLPNPVRPGL